MARAVCLAFVIGLASASMAWAQSPRGGGNAPHITTPEQLRWSSAAGMPGVSQAWLIGHPGKSGFYVVRRHLRLGGQVPPRIDAHTIFLTVLSGDVYVGHDEQIDPKTATRCPVGTFMIIPGGSSHYLWARYGEAVVEEWGTVPPKTDEPSSMTEPSPPRP